MDANLKDPLLCGHRALMASFPVDGRNRQLICASFSRTGDAGAFIATLTASLRCPKCDAQSHRTAPIAVAADMREG